MLRLRLLVTAGVLAAAVAGGASATDALRPVEEASIDHRFREREPSPPSELVVVAVDDVTFGELGLQWPFPRSTFADAADVLREAGAREIVFDVQFTEPTVPDEDVALYDELGRVELAMWLVAGALSGAGAQRRGRRAR